MNRTRRGGLFCSLGFLLLWGTAGLWGQSAVWGQSAAAGVNAAGQSAGARMPRRAVGFAEAGSLALAASAELRNSRAQRALREGAWTLGLRAFLPQISFQVSEDDRLSLTGADSFTKSYTLNMEQLLFDGGKTRSSRKMERAELILLADQIRRDEAAVAETALGAYRRILTSRMMVKIREEALQSLVEQRRIMKEELALGLVIPLDLVQADITVREAELELRFLVLQIENEEKRFAELLGLDEMPELSERVDIHRTVSVPGAETIRRLALGRNTELRRMLHSISQRETGARLASRSWIPAIKATGSYSVSGQRYPLTRQSWTLGLQVQFASPWFSAGAGGNAGWEHPHDRTARAHASFSPLPDPAAGMGAKQAELALALEEENYRRALANLGREAEMETRNLRVARDRRLMALEALSLAAEKYRLCEVLLSLGKITRVELMEERLSYAAKETAAAEASAEMLEAERSLERLIDAPPGTLDRFTSGGDPSRSTTRSEP
ncbi:MAG: TolC family protein [Treponema sp.]|jgi:outer membrane protein TolC|nr:TolC family protein [Treponema sp.]